MGLPGTEGAKTVTWEKLAENRIQEAIERGDLQPPPPGTPLDLREYFALPAAERMGLSVLKSAEVVPPEIEMLKQIAALEGALAESTDAARTTALRDELHLHRVNLALAMERAEAARFGPLALCSDGHAAQLRHDPRKDFQGLVHLSTRVEAAEGETQAGASVLIVKTHGLEHVRGMHRTRSAGGAAGTADALLIEEHQHAFGVHAVEGEIARVGQPMLTIAVDHDTFDPFEHAILEVVPQHTHLVVLVLHELPREFARFAEPDDARHILCAGALPEFLPAANEQWMELRPTVHVEHADAFRAVQLVAGEGEEIDLRLAQRVHERAAKTGSALGKHVDRHVD